MLIWKTITGKLVDLSRKEQEILDIEYENLQYFLHTGHDLGLHPDNKRQALRSYKEIKRREYPILIGKGMLKLEEKPTTICRYRVRIPIGLSKYGLWCTFKSYFTEWSSVELCRSKLYRRDGEYYLYITIRKEVALKKTYSHILPVDLGIRNSAVTVSPSGKPRFYGRRLRRIRGWWFYIHRKLGRKAKKWRNRESRQITDQLHKIARDIVEQAVRYDALIVLGDLRGIRKKKMGTGRRLKRLMSHWPYHRLKSYIVYKANWKGIAVVEIDEGYTSKICSGCGALGRREIQGLFKCPSCGLELNADVNAARNIRARGYMLLAGGDVTRPITLKAVSGVQGTSNRFM